MARMIIPLGSMTMKINLYIAEKYLTHIENMLRAEHGITLRTHYAVSTDEFGRIVGNPNTTLLNNNGTSKYYKTTYFNTVKIKEE